MCERESLWKIQGGSHKKRYKKPVVFHPKGVHKVGMAYIIILKNELNLT